MFQEGSSGRINATINRTVRGHVRWPAVYEVAQIGRASYSWDGAEWGRFGHAIFPDLSPECKPELSTRLALFVPSGAAIDSIDFLAGLGAFMTLHTVSMRQKSDSSANVVF